MSDEAQTIIWESETKHQKLFKSKFGQKKLLRKWFLSYLAFKNDCSEHLKRAFFRGFFANFWVRKLKPFSGKVRMSLLDDLNSMMVAGSFSESGFDVTLRSKTNVLSIWKLNFSAFCKLWVTKFKPFSGKVRQSFQNCLNQSWIMGSFFRKWFWGYLELKNECSERLKRVFFCFLQILSDNVKTVFWEWDSEPSKPFKFKIGKRKLFRKCFGSALEIKNECFERLKRAFFSFFQIVEWPSWNRFLGKQDIAFKTI